MPPPTPASSKRSLALTYILWASGGPWGLHHLYLGRPNQALLWWATFGGFMGLGWIRDIWRIPEYVSEVNESQEYLTWLIARMKKHTTPPFSILRLAAQFFFGMAVGVGAVAGLSMSYTQGAKGTAVQCVVAPLVVGLAVNLVANIGRQQASLRWSLIGAYATVPLFIVNAVHPGSNISHCALAAAVATNWKGKAWRRTPNKPSYKYYALLGLAAMLYLSSWCSCFYNNAYVTTQDGEKVKLRDAIDHIRDSQAWREPLETMRLLWASYGANDFYSAWSELVNAMDPEGELSAYQVLDISPGATEKEIRKAYRKKSLQFHPDKEGTVEQFIAIQKAYDTLSTIQSRRARANMQSYADDDTRKT